MSIFYEIEDDLNIENRWMIGNLNLPESFAWNDVESKSLINTIDWTAEILMRGNALDVTIIDFGLIMANMRFINLLPAKEIEYKKIKILNYKGKETFYLVGVKNAIDCIDKAKSKYELWKDNNDIRPDLAGQYKYFIELKLKAEKIKPYSIIMVKGYEMARIVSEEVKNRFQEHKLKGVIFHRVT